MLTLKVPGYSLGDGVGSLLPRNTDVFNGLQLNPKSTEYLRVNNTDDASTLMNVIVTGADDEGSIVSFPVDILNQGTIPSPTLRVTTGATSDAWCSATFDFKSPEEIKAIQLRLWNDPNAEYDLKDVMCGVCNIWTHDMEDLRVHLPVCIRTDPDRPGYFDCYITNIYFMNGGVSSNIYRLFEHDLMKEMELRNPKDVNSMMEQLAHIKNSALSMMFLWYAVQVHLLNPLSQEYIHRETVPDTTKKSKGKGSKKKPPKKYIKRILIDTDKMSELGVGAPKKHNIKCPVWWVIGHWRTYKSGKHVWINGYWKGVLRDLQAFDVEAREREV